MSKQINSHVTDLTLNTETQKTQNQRQKLKWHQTNVKWNRISWQTQDCDKIKDNDNDNDYDYDKAEWQNKSIWQNKINDQLNDKMLVFK